MLMCVVVLCTSCASSKKVVYLQDVVPLKQQDIEQKYEVYIHNDDLLAIMVNSKNPELALPFNMPMVSYQLGSGSTGSEIGKSTRLNSSHSQQSRMPSSA